MKKKIKKSELKFYAQVLILVSLVLFMFLSETEEEKVDKIFENADKQEYVVKHGDSLWNIATKVSDEFYKVNEGKEHFTDLRDVVYKITKENNLNSSTEVQPGQTLVIPKFK